MYVFFFGLILTWSGSVGIALLAWYLLHVQLIHDACMDDIGAIFSILNVFYLLGWC